MRITRLTVSNWRNFKQLDVPVGDRLFVVGPNASGKSNLLDVFLFLSEIASPGGGLAAAVEQRGGLKSLRSLFARNHKKSRLIIDVELSDGDAVWAYHLAIKGEGAGRNRPLVDSERVTRAGDVVLERPNEHDNDDPERLTQTHLEQISANREFRVLADYFSKVSYFHLVPQLIRDPGRMSPVEDDPFGGDFIAKMNSVTPRTRDAWLKRMEKALRAAVPQFQSLAITTDAAGRPHLHAGYENWRSTPAHQSEVEFSDGTLRLIGLLWAMVSRPANGGVLLLEEPELSLNSAIVRSLPSVLATAQRDRDLQVVMTTHAPDIVDDEGVSPDEVLVMRVTDDGTKPALLSEISEVADEVAADLPLSEIVQGLVEPGDLADLVAVGRKA